MKTKILFASLFWISISCFAEEPVKGKFKDSYLTFESESGDYQFKFDGRIMLDTGIVDSDENPNVVSDTDFRRLRFAVKTVFYNEWAAEFDLDFEGNEVDTKDMWLSYIGLDNWNFKVGHHKPNFSIAELTTSRWYTFLETPTPVAMFNPGRRIGISVNNWRDSYFAGLSVFGDGADVNGSDFDDDDDGVSENFGYALRLALRPLNFSSSNTKHVLHFGLNHLNDRPQSEDESEYRYRSRLESRVADYRFLDTGNIEDVEDVTVNGLEVLYLYNKWFIQSEYMDSTISFNNGDPDYNAEGYYVQGSYFLTGSGRSYGFHDGELGAVKPAKGSSNLEVAIRYSSSDLDDFDANIFGGEADIITLGLNWYANTNILFRLNYSMADLNENADGDGDFEGNDDVKILAGRIQIMF